MCVDISTCEHATFCNICFLKPSVESCEESRWATTVAVLEMRVVLFHHCAMVKILVKGLEER